jgi:ribonuclease G
MDKESNRKLVWEAFHKALARDTTRCNITKISELGLVEMTRKRTRESLLQMITQKCPVCEGRGVIKSTTALAHEILREVRRVGATVKMDRILIECPPPVADLLERYERRYLDELEKRFQKKVDIKASGSMPVDQYKVEGRVVKVEEPQQGGAKGNGSGRRKRGRGGRRGKAGGGEPAAPAGTGPILAAAAAEDEGLARQAATGENENSRAPGDPDDDTP